MSPLSKDETRRDSSLAYRYVLTPYSVIKKRIYVFLCRVLLAVRMVADVTEIRNVIS